jgi:hypothetical protein
MVVPATLPPGPTIPPLPAVLQLNDVLIAAPLAYRQVSRNRRGKPGVNVVPARLPPGPTIPPLPAALQPHDLLIAAPLAYRRVSRNRRGKPVWWSFQRGFHPGRRFRLFRRYANLTTF